MSTLKRWWPVVLVALICARTSTAATITVSVQFGNDGSGVFVYDDDNGGPQRGFTSLLLDFSPSLGSSFGAITLQPSGVGHWVREVRGHRSCSTC